MPRIKRTKKMMKESMPSQVLEQLSPKSRKSLKEGLRILEELMSHEKGRYFRGEPSVDVLDGVKDYKQIIRTPMWFLEIKRKLNSGEYESLIDFVKDVRLVFENCYYFWGFRHKFTSYALELEHIFEKNLLNLQMETKRECSLESTHGAWSDEELEQHYINYCPFHENENTGEYCSNLILRTWMKSREEEKEEHRKLFDLSGTTAEAEDVIKWENEILANDVLDKIRMMWELPELGLFLYLAKDALNIPQYPQFVIERMFLVPEYSSALSTISSALLRLYYNEETETALLTYTNWSKKMKKVVSEWYRQYEETAEKVPEAVGVELRFFDIVGKTNPFEENDNFCELAYEKRVWILLSLCSCSLRNHPEVTKSFDELGEDAYPQHLGVDRNGCDYLLYQMFLDFRVYKMSRKNEDSAVQTNERRNLYYGSLEKYPPWHLFILHGVRYELVADSIEGLRSLITDLIKEGMRWNHKKSSITNDNLIETLQELLVGYSSSASEYATQTNKARIEIYKEARTVASDLEQSSSNSESLAETECQKSGKKCEDDARFFQGFRHTLSHTSQDEDSEDTISERRKRKCIKSCSYKNRSSSSDSSTNTEGSDDDWRAPSKEKPKIGLKLKPPVSLKKILKEKLAERTKKSSSETIEDIRKEVECIKQSQFMSSENKASATSGEEANENEADKAKNDKESEPKETGQNEEKGCELNDAEKSTPGVVTIDSSESDDSVVEVPAESIVKSTVVRTTPTRVPVQPIIPRSSPRSAVPGTSQRSPVVRSNIVPSRLRTPTIPQRSPGVSSNQKFQSHTPSPRTMPLTSAVSITPITKPTNRAPETPTGGSGTCHLTKSVTITPRKTSTVQRKLFKNEVEGVIELKYSPQGNTCYVVKLANGVSIPLSNGQVQNLRDGNKGVLPRTIKIPVSPDVADKIEPCFIIDD